MFMVLNVCLFVNLILDALSSEFHSTSSTTESPLTKEQWERSEQKAKIMETVKLEGEKEIKKTCINLIKLIWKAVVNSDKNYVTHVVRISSVQ